MLLLLLFVEDGWLISQAVTAPGMIGSENVSMKSDS